MEAREPALTEYLEANEPKGFNPAPYYEPSNDTLIFFESEEEAYAKRLDSVVTVYLSFEGDKIVGFELKGIKRRLEKARQLEMVGENGGIRYMIRATAVTHADSNQMTFDAVSEALIRAAQHISDNADDILETDEAIA